MDLIQFFRANNINCIVYSSEIEQHRVIQEAKASGIVCYYAVDSRSAMYMATGIAANNNATIACVVNSSNASRSVFSGMTEAFYRNLPIILVTVGQDLDYSNELRDVIRSHYVANKLDVLENVNKEKLPMHIELSSEGYNVVPKKCERLFDILSDMIDDNIYMLISACIKADNCKFKCKVVKSGLPNCLEGALANLLGASLAKKRNRYIGVMTESEFIHDVNTLGNIHVNDRVICIVISSHFNQAIEDYANSLGFTTNKLFISNFDCDLLKTVIYSNNKMIVQVIGEE